ncbi:hypothetical protein AQUCO_02500099v1 [Aquilegia coerulea]|uniref:Uncharacterized protein n=1 Tax=Aquilegia coerulea TaxID=218851 RepID=A0A2G5D9G1_AQUCA|nr:hypothetical protein AQUCO_02500099v1 [Aquilegia coerulea]
MDFSSWFRKTLLKNQKPSPTTQTPNMSPIEAEEELGVTDQLQNFLKSFTFETFKNFPLQDDRLDTTSTTTNNGSSVNIHKDLSEWQERHATFVLYKCKVTLLNCFLPLDVSVSIMSLIQVAKIKFHVCVLLVVPF